MPGHIGRKTQCVEAYSMTIEGLAFAEGSPTSSRSTSLFGGTAREAVLVFQYIGMLGDRVGPFGPEITSFVCVVCPSASAAEQVGRLPGYRKI